MSKIDTRSAEEVGVFIADGLRDMTNQERVRVFDALWDYYCQHCGREQGPKMIACQCWRDE